MEMLWTAVFAPLSATNRHVTASHGFLTLSLAATVACFLLPGTMALDGIGLALIAANLAMLVLSAWLLHRQWRPAHPAAATGAGSKGAGA